MRAYADSSFLVKLIVRERGTELAAAEYRRLGRPRLFYLPLHALETENAVRQRGFHSRRSLPAEARGQIKREAGAALAGLQTMLDRGFLLEVAADWEEAVRHARALSAKHTDATGARSFDLLHVAFALDLESELFVTTDERQARVAGAEGLKVVSVAEAD